MKGLFIYCERDDFNLKTEDKVERILTDHGHQKVMQKNERLVTEKSLLKQSKLITHEAVSTIIAGSVLTVWKW